MNTVPRRQLRGLPQGLCPFPCAAPPRRRASCRLCPRCRLCPLCLSLRHLCGCLSAANDDNTHAALPKHTVPDAGQARYYNSSRRRRGRWLSMGRVVVVLSPSLSPSVRGGGMLSRRLCRRAVCRRQPFPPHSLGCRSVLCGQSGSAPSLHPRGTRGGMCGEQPTCRLALGAHTELLAASVRCRWVRTLCVCTAATVRAGESQRDLKSPLPLSSTSRSLSPSLPPSLSLSLSCRQLSHPLAMSMTVLEGQEHQHAPASSTGGTLIAQRC